MKKLIYILLLFSISCNSQTLQLLDRLRQEQIPQGGQQTANTVVMSNFTVKVAEPSRIYFDLNINATGGLNRTGLVVSPNRGITGITLLQGIQTSYFDLDVALNWYDNITIRYDGGSDIIGSNSEPFYKFTIEYVNNNLAEPTSIATRYVSTTAAGGGNGQSTSTPWTLTEAFANAASGQTVYVKAGDYGDLNLTMGLQATKINTIKFIGYKTTPGDITTNYYDNNVTFSSAEMPTITNNSLVNDQSISMNNALYITFENFQFTNGQRGVYGNNTNSRYITFKNCNWYLFGDASNNGAGVYVETRDVSGIIGNNNWRFIGCVFKDCAQSNLMLNGTGSSLIKDCKTYNTRTASGERTDYQIAFTGSNNIVIGCYSENINSTSTNSSTHGIGVRGQDTYNSQYNLIQNCEAVNMQEGVYVRNFGADFNVIKDCTVRNNGAPLGYAYPSGISVFGGGANNIFERNTIKDVNAGIYLVDNGEDSHGTDEVADNNIFRNNTFENINYFMFITGAVNNASFTGNKFYNNTISGANYFYRLATSQTVTNSGNLVTNNILKGVTNGALGSTLTGFTFNYNDFFNSWTTGIGVNDVNLDPVLDVSLNFTASSPVGVTQGGTVLTDVPYDYLKLERTSPYSIGAYEKN